MKIYGYANIDHKTRRVIRQDGNEVAGILMKTTCK